MGTTPASIKICMNDLLIPHHTPESEQEPPAQSELKSTYAEFHQESLGYLATLAAIQPEYENTVPKSIHTLQTDPPDDPYVQV